MLGEILTGPIIAVLLTFFLLKDGERIWGFLLGLFGRRTGRDADQLGRRPCTALAAYMRGIALVGLVDAILIGIAPAVIGVPLVLPLMIITFFAAFVPLIGAFVAGLIAVLIALVSGGPLDAALPLAAIVLVQQVEGHVLYPVLMSRTVHLHPAVIIIALAAGGVLGGIIGVFLGMPVAGILSLVLAYSRDRPHQRQHGLPAALQVAVPPDVGERGEAAARSSIVTPGELRRAVGASRDREPQIAAVRCGSRADGLCAICGLPLRPDLGRRHPLYPTVAESRSRRWTADGGGSGCGA